MNPHYQRFLTDEWLPGDQDIEAITIFGRDEAEISLRESPNMGIKSDELVYLSDMR